MKKNYTSLQDFFKVMIFASGTPAAYQISVGRANKENICACSPKEAIDNKWIQRPVLNLVHGNFKTQFPEAIDSVLNREIEVCRDEVFKPTILVNFPGIDDIRTFINLPTVKSQIGERFHLVTIHSTKQFDIDNEFETLKSTVDGEEIDSAKAYEIIEKIDEDYFSDSLPIIVCQVDMIGEGINVQSFNAVITTSNSDKKVMQQVGRGMRNYFKDGKSKVEDGHCNLYIVYDNMEQVPSLINNLAEFDLTADCFGWGKKIDINTGSGQVFNTVGLPDKANQQNWDDIDLEHDLEIQTYLTKWDEKRLKKMTKSEIGYWLKFQDDELDKLHEALKADGWSSFYKNFNNKYAFLYEQVMNITKLQHSDEIMKNVWKNNTKIFLKMMTKNDNFAEFLNDHLSDNLKNQLLKV